jgi:hypothetical protein
MNSKSHIKSIFLFTIFLLAATALTNYIVDPGNIYPKYYSQESQVTEEVFVKKLIESKYGLLMPKNTWNERDIKKALAEYSMNYDCAVIGSSHIMQISSNRQNKSLTSLCSSLKNLGVSGGSLEDYLAMSNIILKNTEFLPKTVVFGIDPWSLNFGKDKRWSGYEQDYFEMKSKLSLKYPSTHLNDNNNSNKDLLINLFNLQYLKRSLSVISKPKIEAVTPVSKFNQNSGLALPVTLPDGSYIYSAEFIGKAKNSIKTIPGKNSYKIVNNFYYQDVAIKTFEKLIQHLINSKITVAFILTPYHHRVWNHTEQPIIKAFNIIEGKVHDIAKQYKIQVIGSYNPDNIGCLENEFYDGMHPMDTCLMKLENRSISY